jgi:hypothetical protein
MLQNSFGKNSRAAMTLCGSSSTAAELARSNLGNELPLCGSQAAERGQQLFKRQSYTITNILGQGIALPWRWTGLAFTAVPIQNLPPDSDHTAVFLQFRAGRCSTHWAHL